MSVALAGTDSGHKNSRTTLLFNSWESGVPEHGLCVAAASGAQQGLPEPQLHPEAPTVRCRWCGCLGCSWNPQAVASH